MSLGLIDMSLPRTRLTIREVDDLLDASKSLGMEMTILDRMTFKTRLVEQDLIAEEPNRSLAESLRQFTVDPTSFEVLPNGDMAVSGNYQVGDPATSVEYSTYTVAPANVVNNMQVDAVDASILTLAHFREMQQQMLSALAIPPEHIQPKQPAIEVLKPRKRAIAVRRTA